MLEENDERKEYEKKIIASLKTETENYRKENEILKQLLESQKKIIAILEKRW